MRLALYVHFSQTHKVEAANHLRFERVLQTEGGHEWLPTTLPQYCCLNRRGGMPTLALVGCRHWLGTPRWLSVARFTSLYASLVPAALPRRHPHAPASKQLQRHTNGRFSILLVQVSPFESAVGVQSTPLRQDQKGNGKLTRCSCVQPPCRPAPGGCPYSRF